MIMPMADVTLPYSLTVYQVEEEKYLQTKGQEVQLTIDMDGFKLVKKDGTTKQITASDIIKVDLNNVLSKEYFSIYTNDEKIILTYYEPQTYGKMIKRGLGNTNNPSNLVNFIDETMSAAGIKQAVNMILPPEKIVQRKELRLGRTIAIGVAIPVLLFLAFILVLKLVL